MEKVIVVTGAKNSGKTNSIHKFSEIIGCSITANSPRDMFMIVDLKLGGTIYGIGIASAGDDAKTIKRNLDAFYNQELSFVITACSAPRVGMPLLKGFAMLNRAELIELKIDRTPTITQQQVESKALAIAQQIRSHLP